MKNKTVYYRASIIENKIGDIIKKGSGIYGKLNFNNQLSFYETYLELARRLHHPKEVSRFDCVFACKTKEALANYIKTYHISLINDFFIYAIKPTNKNPKISIANFKIPTFRNNAKNLTFDEAIEDMKVYWDNKNIEPNELEVLIGSDCEVVKIFNKIRLTF